jgi:hypothetical protein
MPTDLFTKDHLLICVIDIGDTIVWDHQQLAKTLAMQKTLDIYMPLFSQYKKRLSEKLLSWTLLINSTLSEAKPRHQGWIL